MTGTEPVTAIAKAAHLLRAWAEDAGSFDRDVDLSPHEVDTIDWLRAYEQPATPPSPAEYAPTAYYFGCWAAPGHVFWLPGMKSPPQKRPQWYVETPWKSHVDGTLTPGRRDSRGRLDPHATRPQSAAALHHKDGWTALAMHDYTGDSRGNSNSVFFFDRTLTAVEAIVAARYWFPRVMDRIEKAAPITVEEP